MKSVQQSLIPPHTLTVSVRARPQKCEGHSDLSGISQRVLLCCAAPHAEIRCWEKQSCHSGLPVPGSEGQCQTAITASFPACDTWHTPCQMGLKEFFFVKPQQIFSLGAVCIQFGVCKGECKGCAAVRDPPGTPDVPHLAVRLNYRMLTHVCQVVSSCVYLLKCTRVAVNRAEKLSATMRESEPSMLLLQ